MLKLSGEMLGGTEGGGLKKSYINLVADVEHGRAGGGEEHIAAMLKLEWVFNYNKRL